MGRARVGRIPWYVNLAGMACLMAIAPGVLAQSSAPDLPLIRQSVTSRPKATYPPVLKVPFKVDFSLDDAERRTGPLRESIVLNGFWRWQPVQAGRDRPDGDAWLYRAAPCAASVSDFPVRDAAGKTVRDLNGKPVTGKEQAWIERGFRIPPDWTGRRVWITLEDTLNGAEVFLDGRSAGYVWQGLPFDLPLSDAAAGSEHTITLKGTGLANDAWLCSGPRNLLIQDVWSVGLWRSKRLEVRVEGAGKPPLGAKVRAWVSADAAGTDHLADLAPVPCAKTGDGWLATAAGDWDPRRVKPWSPRQPDLCWVQCEVLDASGAVIDRALPVRSGFREIWLSGGDIVCNGTPIHIYGDNIEPLMGHANRISAADGAYIRFMLDRWKEVGLNAFCGWAWASSEGEGAANAPLVLDCADEKGFLVNLWVPRRGQYARFAGIAEVDWYVTNRLKLFVRMARAHPSVLSYVLGSGSHVWDYNPGKLADNYDPAKTWAAIAAFQAETAPDRQLLSQLDPTRTWIYHSGGNASPVHTSMAYLGFDMDLQERVNWPLAWSRTRHKPLMVTETGFPLSYNWFARPSRGQWPVKGTWILNLEFAAMYFGQEPYLKEPADELATHANGGGSGMIYTPSQYGWRLEELFTDECIRAWRTYGMNFLLHGPVAMWFEPQTVPRDFSPHRRGTVADRMPADEHAGPLSPKGLVAQKALRPLLAYIGGPKDSFTAKDHAFVAGEIVRKSAVVINDLEADASLNGTWRLAGPDGKDLAGGRLIGKVPAGGRAFLPIEFACPEADGRLACSLEISLNDGKHSDRFALQIYPRLQPSVQIDGEVRVFDPVGDTTRLLARTGIKVKPLRTGEDINPNDLLVIGRGALNDSKVSQDLARRGLDAAVEKGASAGCL